MRAVRAVMFIAAGFIVGGATVAVLLGEGTTGAALIVLAAGYAVIASCYRS